MTIPGLAWARRTLRRQLDTLGRLAAAMRMIETSAQAAFERPSVRALEKAVHAQCRIDWAMRLLDALRRKLKSDLEAVERGELPQAMLEPPPEKSERRETSERGGSSPREPYDRESFGRFLGPASDKELAKLLKRPTDEILALIAKELGLLDDWLQEAEEAWNESEDPDPIFSPAQPGRWLQAQPQDGGGAPESPPKPPPPWPRFV